MANCEKRKDTLTKIVKASVFLTHYHLYEKDLSRFHQQDVLQPRKRKAKQRERGKKEVGSRTAFSPTLWFAMRSDVSGGEPIKKTMIPPALPQETMRYVFHNTPVFGMPIYKEDG